VGGTGFYLEALMRGLADLPEVDRALRAALIAEADEIGWDRLHEKLMQIDRDFASAIHSTDRTRILRGWEIYRQTGTPPSRFLAESPRRGLKEPIVVIWVDLPRLDLYARIEHRVGRMVEQGLFQEVASLLGRGFGPDSPGLATVGYQEVIAYHQGHISASEAVRLIVRNTRRYAKRQITWFRHRAYATPIKTEDNTVERVMGLWAGESARYPPPC
jgi:tRNA dimethylallyltransferase